MGSALRTNVAAALAAVGAWGVPLIAQQDCGTVLLPEHVDIVLARMEAGLYDPPQGGPRSGYYVPLTFHVVRRSDGSGGIDPAQLVRALDDANLYYANAGIRFCWPGPTDYIDSDHYYYDIDTMDEIDALRSTNVVPDTINIYFTENLAVGNNALCGISSFTFSDVQGIVMANSCTGSSSNHSTFPHEIGHYFDLFHTHETMFDPECVSCCNCNIAGDLLCDTPADPELGWHNVDSGCGYIGTERDGCNNELYHPDTTNLMSYSRAACRTTFTNQQNFRMAATLTRLRPELLEGFCAGENDWTLDGKLTTSDGAANDEFGWSVSISGDTAVVGAYYDDDRGANSGSAYVFEKVGGVWTQRAKLLASDGAANDEFGISISVSGDTAVVGARYGDDRGTNSGSAYVFEKVGGVWTQKVKLLASDGAANDEFGWSVSISGDSALVGALFDDDRGTDSGSAYVFEKVGGEWTQKATLLASDGAASDYFGSSVSISGDTAVIGALLDDDRGTDSGSAYVFEKLGGVWTQKAKLRASDGVASDYFGSSVSISGDTAVVGAYQDDDRGANSGSAYVFEKVGGVWTQKAKLLASDGVASDYFGSSVSISGDTAVVGAYYDDDRGANSGSAYVFEKVGGVWTQKAKLLASDGAASDECGWSVSISGDTVVIGARYDDDRATDSGSAYVWMNLNELRLCPGDFNEDGVVDTRDVVAFLNAWVAGDSRADFNEDGVIDTRDVITFLNAWVEDC